MLIKKYRAVESHVVFANEMDEEAIIDLWKQCFGDSKEYIQMYLGRRFTTENMLVIHDDGRPVAMASFLPVQIMINGEMTDARYVYAVGTLPDYRKKGYATEIIRYAFKKYQMPLILQPAEEMLERYLKLIIVDDEDAPEVKYQKGDVNLDGKVDIKDATLVQKYLAKLCDFTELQCSLADFNEDSIINIFDVTAINKYIAKIS